MAIPKFQDFLYPFLNKLGKEKEVSSKEMKKFLIEHFGLTEEDCALKTKSGQTVQFEDRVGWTRQWLRRALLITIPQRGLYQITQRGANYLQTHTTLQESDLLEFPEYAAYAGRTPKKNNSSISESNESSSNNKKTPTENLENAYDKIVKDLAADLLQKILEQSPEKWVYVDLSG